MRVEVISAVWEQGLIEILEAGQELFAGEIWPFVSSEAGGILELRGGQSEGGEIRSIRARLEIQGAVGQHDISIAVALRYNGETRIAAVISHEIEHLAERLPVAPLHGHTNSLAAAEQSAIT